MPTKKLKLMKPEKQVECDVLAWAFENGFSFDVYDSKGTFSEAKGRYSSNTGMKTGTPDLIGNSSCGLAAYVELKDPQKDQICSLDQYNFLSRKIDSGAFAAVVSSPQDLSDKWFSWLRLRNEPQKARDFLRSQLPKKVLVNKRILNVF